MWRADYLTRHAARQIQHTMQTYWVQLRPDGKWDGNPYQKVGAGSSKEAAETLCGRPLDERGNNHQLRAEVPVVGRSSRIAFSDRDAA
jgi:hypothetical protein